MKSALTAALIMLASAVPLQAQSVAGQSGDIALTGKDGATRMLTTGGGFDQPVLSPDGHTVVFIHTDGKPVYGDDFAPNSLWIADARGGAPRKLFGISYKEWVATLWSPVFSLDGRFVYVVYNASAVSGAVVRVDIATGKARPVIDGRTVSVLRNGPYRGYLLVQRHKYWPLPRAGSYNPVDLVRPDGKVMFTVPGSARDDGEKSLDRWLRRTGWKTS